ncbi:putative ATPase [Lysinibacillus composti]|uniref:ATP-binding cassette domain-containing protein n=1 Tax=Lysinibacillus composti TaxID=720633 RepID=A0A3N9UJQ9_9BACI|nr:AAA family ATPase [Lysinibacillus composti]MBM7607221.1 putative ATPase [Lysinibacillus composti]RQW76200.1 ATP-binding cassette domain-containing protein [Lysinibacillus composti]
MYLKTVRYLKENIPDEFTYPFSIPSLSTLDEIQLPTNITFFVGENGSGKSTLLEAIADLCEFNTAGGGRQHLYDVHKSDSALSDYIRLSWKRKISRGFFLRAETFYQFASHIDLMDEPEGIKYASYGGKSLHQQSHGESFLSLFQNAFGKKSLYLLDEPEAALSPVRQLSLMKIMKDLEEEAQFIIATHSPILLGYPDATIYSFDDGKIEAVRYEDTTNYIVTKSFLNAPDRMLDELFKEEE